MLKLQKPEFDQGKIIDDCMANMVDGEPKRRLIASKSEIVTKSKEYDEEAKRGELYTLEEKEVLDNGATKKDMVDLYDRKFARYGEGGRKYYDAIRLLSPNNRCPYCGQRDVTTLDHYLPKTKFPVYAVNPYNLLPSCAVCNKDKLKTSYRRREEETIHPYYDDFYSERWIAANMIEGEPIAFEFYVECPDSWSEEKKIRAKHHFEVFRLNKLYQPYASEEFRGSFSRIKRLYLTGGKKLAIAGLEEDILDRECIRLNTWQAAMYRAIIASDWFWNSYLPMNLAGPGSM